MADIIVTTPKGEMQNAADEAADVLEAGGGRYFRTFRHSPPNICPGDRVFYVEDGFVRGFASVVETVAGGRRRCDTTGREWGEGFHVIMDARSWKWIAPIPMVGFRGWRYWGRPVPATIGDWRAPKPGQK